MTFIANFYEWALDNKALAILVAFFTMVFVAIGYALAPTLVQAAMVGLFFVGVIYVVVEISFG